MPQLQESGLQKMVKETVAVEAPTFGVAERTATEKMAPCVSGELKVVNINPAPYGEIFTSDDVSDDKFYKCKLFFIIIDEKTGKEKSTKVTYLVQASSTNKAQTYIDKHVMAQSVQDYKTCSISETKITETLFCDKDENGSV